MLDQITPDTTSVLISLLEAYGPTGLAFAALLTMLIRGKKQCEERNERLEKRVNQLEARHLEEHKEMIKDYNSALRDNGSVIAKLTSCLTAIKDTLERIDRRTEGQ